PVVSDDDDRPEDEEGEPDRPSRNVARGFGHRGAPARALRRSIYGRNSASQTTASRSALTFIKDSRLAACFLVRLSPRESSIQTPSCKMRPTGPCATESLY